MTANGQVTDRHLDLDAARRARAEKRGKPPTVTFLGREWTLPSTLSADVIDFVGVLMGDDPNPAAAVGAIRLLLGGETYEQMRTEASATGQPLDIDDIMDLLSHAMTSYGVTLPESSGSAEAS